MSIKQSIITMLYLEALHLLTISKLGWITHLYKRLVKINLFSLIGTYIWCNTKCFHCYLHINGWYLQNSNKTSCHLFECFVSNWGFHDCCCCIHIINNIKIPKNNIHNISHQELLQILKIKGIRRLRTSAQQGRWKRLGT